MTTTPTPAELTMARAILAERQSSHHVAGLEAQNSPEWQSSLRYAQAAEKARQVGEVPEGCADASAVRADFRTFLRRAAEGQGVTITRYGKPIARLLPAAPSPPEGLAEAPVTHAT